jgi:uncharacterized protein
MHYIIDGHNLIPHVRGLSLSAMDDEKALIEMLQVFCRVRRQKVEVYFDRAAPGQAGARRFGTITAHFTPVGMTADDAIIQRLHAMKGNAPNISVVTSDHRIQRETQSCHARLVPSPIFAGELQAALQEDQKRASAQGEPLNAAQIDEWLKLFSNKS